MTTKLKAAEMDSIKEFYAGRSIFLTGATGFVGKVLIEKLLRSCPKLDKIYILIRAKKGKLPEQRVQDMVNVPLFDKLKETHPHIVEQKVKPVLGDVAEIGLGLSKADRQELIENVSIIFHGAASVRFDDTLKYAITLNTRGTREVLNLGLEMKKLDVFLHISTTYCNVDRMEVDEKLYPPHADWQKSIMIAENVDEDTLQLLSMKYIDAMPNTYTFTKSLAEHVVTDLCRNKIPAVIFRPSIVISTRNDPFPGWVDNFNGPVGLLVASGKGILRTSYANPNARPDYMPVDTAVRALLLAAWHKGTTIDPKEKMDVSFYNCSNNGMYTLTTKQLIDFGRQIFWEAPFSNILWYPGGGITNCKYWNYIKVIFLHLLPAVILDRILVLLNKKPILVKVQRRIYIANMALQHFILNQWKFVNDKCLALEEKLLPDEVNDFGFDKYNVNVFDYFRNCIRQGRKFLMKEDDSTIESAKKNLHRMYVLDSCVRLLLYFILIWLVFYKFQTKAYIISKCYSIYDALLWK